ncbi:transporter substrate-binding domain-containing protein [Xanthobacter agilis]|nr:transporter substrate-binding domain-containing protein [Xanthobacter agilis]
MLMRVAAKCASAAAVAAVLVSAALPARADTLAEIEKAKVVRIAVPQDFAPFGSVGPDLQPRGYDIDMANYIAKQLGVKVELVPVSSANRIAYLQTHKVDLVISSLGKNPEREKVIDFSAPYAPFFSGVYGLKGEGVADAAGLAGKTAGATRGSIEEQELTRLVPASTTVKRYEDNNATVSAFISGQVDYIATGNTVAAAVAEKSPSRKPELKFIIKDSPCYVGLNKDEPALLAKVNAIIAKAKADGTLAGFSETWLKAPLPANF